MSSIDKHITREELNKTLERRWRSILEKFDQVTTLKVRHPKLLSILEDVKTYWKDTRTRLLFRPALTSFSCEAVGGKPESAEDAGLIFILAASGIGIHDDILDKSRCKHLRKTILGIHGEDSALLVGDLLLIKAWTMFHEMISNADKALRIADIMKVYGNLSIEICEAEFMETMCRRNLETDLDHYANVLWMAMAEIEACTRIGAMIGNGNSDEIEALAKFGRRLGLISRLADEIEDCLNLKGDLPHRIEYESVPFPLLYAAKRSREKYLEIKKIINKTQITSSDAKALVKSCFDTEAFDYVHSIARKNEAKAASELLMLKPSNARNLLSEIKKGVYDRIDALCI